MPLHSWPAQSSPSAVAPSSMQAPRPQAAGWIGRSSQQADPSAPAWPGTAPQAKPHQTSDPRQPWRAPADAALPTGLQPGSPSPAAVARAFGPSTAGAAGHQQQHKDHEPNACAQKPYTVTEPDSPFAGAASGQLPAALPAAPWQAGPCGAPAPRACLYTETTVTRWQLQRPYNTLCLCTATRSSSRGSAAHWNTRQAFPWELHVSPASFCTFNPEIFQVAGGGRTVPPTPLGSGGRQDSWTVREVHHYAGDRPQPERYIYAGSVQPCNMSLSVAFPCPCFIRGQPCMCGAPYQSPESDLLHSVALKHRGLCACSSCAAHQPRGSALQACPCSVHTGACAAGGWPRRDTKREAGKGAAR
jgi:hypothetical protein